MLTYVLLFHVGPIVYVVMVGAHARFICASDKAEMGYILIEHIFYVLPLITLCIDEIALFFGRLSSFLTVL